MSGLYDEDEEEDQYALPIGAEPGEPTPPLLGRKRYSYPSAYGVTRRDTACRRTASCALVWESPYWVARPGRLYRPEALHVPGAPDGARVTEYVTGRNASLTTVGGPIPLSFLAYLDALEARTGKRSPARPQLLTCELGSVIRIRIEAADGTPLGPPLEPVLSGITAD